MTNRRTESTRLNAELEKNGELATQKKPYAPPEILSVEPLEAVAAACDTTGNPAQFGKTLACIQAQS